MNPETEQLESSVVDRANIGLQLSETAARRPDEIAIAVPTSRRAGGKDTYRTISFLELDEDSDRLAAGLLSLGLTKGQRIVLMVRPGIDQARPAQVAKDPAVNGIPAFPPDFSP